MFDLFEVVVYVVIEKCYSVVLCVEFIGEDIDVLVSVWIVNILVGGLMVVVLFGFVFEGYVMMIICYFGCFVGWIVWVCDGCIGMKFDDVIDFEKLMVECVRWILVFFCVVVCFVE